MASWIRAVRVVRASLTAASSWLSWSGWRRRLMVLDVFAFRGAPGDFFCMAKPTPAGRGTQCKKMSPGRNLW